MIVLEKALKKVHPEIDMVTTPTGKPVAMVHCNNGTSDISAWVNLFSEFATAMGIDANKNDIYAVLCPTTLKGYIFVEGMNTDRMREKPRDIRKARTFVDGEIGIDEIQHYLTPVSPVKGVTEGDLVELVNGPFKGEKARVQKIDEAKEEITVELIEAMVPIPVTVKGESFKVIGK
jgi:transcription elongation factor Spt5